MNLEDAVFKSGTGITITLDVSPGSKKTQFPSGYNEWRKAILCRISAPPVDGKANKEIERAVSDFFSIPKRNVSIISGQTSSLKRVLIEGIEPDRAVELLKSSINK
ncbi:DUF167 domain-containing protein [Methanoplanus limicola]|uniref:UPF0235 protein Metlim_0128 n=1 Tax=Methanoplanus limicola DSM 2279 TaxID=937775 RepID=H1YZ52_9EURY|nr:DUF167 domain-containing protein [Methanoplanus limicola]EHQ34281.1 UPF0235 protein yggU [Methanoplanus limicola DSM 2279]